MKLSLLMAAAAVAVVSAAMADDLRARAPGDQAPAVNETARQLADFRDRVDKYVSLRKRAARDGPPLRETNDPAAIRAAQDGLAARIRALRADARAGDIFTVAVRPVFRRLLAPQLKGEGGRDTRAAINDDAPPSVPLKVNAKYPETAALPTVPANILAALPPLPKELEYRLVKKDLLLFDPEAEIIVDYLANAIR